MWEQNIADMTVKCFAGIKTEQLHRAIEKTDLGGPETVIIHVGTNDLRTTRNLEFSNGRSICVGGYGKGETPELQTCPVWSAATYRCVMAAYWGT